MHDYSPMGKYWYKILSMGVANSPDIFQQKMNDLFHGFEFICAYIYDLLIWTKRLLDISCTEARINSKQTEGKKN